jgi:hypothetical protein
VSLRGVERVGAIIEQGEKLRGRPVPVPGPASFLLRFVLPRFVCVAVFAAAVGPYCPWFPVPRQTQEAAMQTERRHVALKWRAQDMTIPQQTVLIFKRHTHKRHTRKDSQFWRLTAWQQGQRHPRGTAASAPGLLLCSAFANWQAFRACPAIAERTCC